MRRRIALQVLLVALVCMAGALWAWTAFRVPHGQYEDYEDWDDFDWMYEFDRQDEIQEQKELSWKQFEMAQAVEAVPEDDLESAFNGVWKQFAA